MAKSNLTPERLQELLTYNPDTGLFFWNKTGKGRRIDRLAGCTDGKGYWMIRVNGEIFRAHRLAWLYVHKYWPSLLIDHINGERSDNRISNLREATNSENHENQRDSMSHKKSDCLLGVSYCKDRNLWQASIKYDGKANFLGRFKTKELAHQAYLDAKIVNHGFCSI